MLRVRLGSFSLAPGSAASHLKKGRVAFGFFIPIDKKQIAICNENSINCEIWRSWSSNKYSGDAAEMATGFINRLYGQELKEVKQTSR